MQIPQTLQEKINTYLDDGTFLDLGLESFKDASWQTMYNGFQLYPKKIPANIGALDLLQLTIVADKMRAAIIAGVSHAPSHLEFLATLPNRGN